MNLTSLLPIAAAAFSPWAAAANPLAAATPFASWLGTSHPEPAESGKEAAATEPNFPLSSSDRDRLERLLADDLDLLASLLRADPKLALSEDAQLDLTIAAGGEACACATEEGGGASEAKLGSSDELNSVLRRIGATLQRLEPPESSADDAARPPSAGWQIRVDRAGARLL